MSDDNDDDIHSNSNRNKKKCIKSNTETTEITENFDSNPRNKKKTKEKNPFFYICTQTHTHT